MSKSATRITVASARWSSCVSFVNGHSNGTFLNGKPILIFRVVVLFAHGHDKHATLPFYLLVSSSFCRFRAVTDATSTRPLPLTIMEPKLLPRSTSFASWPANSCSLNVSHSHIKLCSKEKDEMCLDSKKNCRLF
jgi:hypothetical protein